MLPAAVTGGCRERRARNVQHQWSQRQQLQACSQHAEQLGQQLYSVMAQPILTQAAAAHSQARLIQNSSASCRSCSSNHVAYIHSLLTIIALPPLCLLCRLFNKTLNLQGPKEHGRQLLHWQEALHPPCDAGPLQARRDGLRAVDGTRVVPDQRPCANKVGTVGGQGREGTRHVQRS